MLQGWFGAIYAVSATIGPLVGGVFTDQISWRWVVSFMGSHTNIHAAH
jgi:MFS family permease